MSATLTARRTWPASVKALPDALALLLLGAASVFAAAGSLRLSYDDAFITYRYAYNLASGHGFVYNAGEWFLGTTAPLYGLLLAAFGALGGPDLIPAASGWLSGATLLLSSLALYVYGRQHGQWLCGLLAGLFFATNRLLPLTFGGEMLLQTALLLWGFVAYRAERTSVAAALLALAILTRMDSLLAAGIIGLHYLATRRRMPWRELLIAALILLPPALLAWRAYGSLLPDTFAAKLAQRDSGLWPPFARGSLEYLRAFTIQDSSTLFPGIIAAPNAIRFVLFAALGLPALALYRFWLLPLAWPASFFLAYSLLGVPFYGWYIVPTVLGLMILAACGVAGVVEPAVRVTRRFVGAVRVDLARSVLSAACLLALAPGLVAQLQHARAWAELNPIERLYEKTGVWLREHTPPDSSVGYFEIGRVGYYAQRTMIDPLGLIDPSVAPHVAQRDLLWAYARSRPDYILYNERFAGWFRPLLQQPWFRDEYRPLTEISERDTRSHDVFTLSIYQRATPRR